MPPASSTPNNTGNPNDKDASGLSSGSHDAIPPVLNGEEDDEGWEDEESGDEGKQHKSKKTTKPIPHLSPDSDEENLPAGGLSSWAERNPGKGFIPLQKRVKRVLGPEQRRTLKDARANRKRRAAALQEDILVHEESNNIAVTDLAAKHGFKEKLVRQRAGLAGGQKKRTRKPSLLRAKIHYLGKKVNRGLGPGEKVALEVLRQRALDENDPEFVDMSEARKKELIQGVLDYRELKVSGTRATNKAAQLGAEHSLERMNDEVQYLYRTCGMQGFSFFSKGHVQDTTNPRIIQSAGALDFIREVIGMDPMDFNAKFEQWACAKGDAGADTLKSMCSEVTRMIKSGLVIASKRQQCAMNYERYIQSVVLSYGCELIGWPKDVDWGPPNKISTVEKIRKLRDALKDGSCRWKVLNEKEKKRWRALYEEKVSSGEIVSEGRKKRSDSGKSRGPNKRTLGKVAGKGKQKSREEVPTDEDDDDDDEEWGGITGGAGGEEDDSEDVGGKAVRVTRSRQTVSKSSRKRKSGGDDEDEEDEEAEKEKEPPKKRKKSSEGPRGEKRNRKEVSEDEEEEEESTRKKKKPSNAPNPRRPAPIAAFKGAPKPVPRKLTGAANLKARHDEVMKAKAEREEKRAADAEWLKVRGEQRRAERKELERERKEKAEKEKKDAAEGIAAGEEDVPMPVAGSSSQGGSDGGDDRAKEGQSNPVQAPARKNTVKGSKKKGPPGFRPASLHQPPTENNVLPPPPAGGEPSGHVQ